MLACSLACLHRWVVGGFWWVGWVGFCWLVGWVLVGWLVGFGWLVALRIGCDTRYKNKTVLSSTCMHIRIHARTYTHAHTHAIKCAHTHAHTHACAHRQHTTHTHTHTHTHTRTRTHTHTHRHTVRNHSLKFGVCGLFAHQDVCIFKLALSRSVLSSF